jgi:hypothetical protein
MLLAIMVVIVIVPIVLSVPAVSVFIPPTVTVVPAVSPGFGEFVAGMICFLTPPPVMLNGFMNAVIGFRNAPLAIIRRCLGNGDEERSSE